MNDNELFNLAYRNDVKGLVNAIEAGADPNLMHSRSGHTPLQAATQVDAIEAIKVLLQLGADPNKRFTWMSRVTNRVLRGRVALMYACSRSAVNALVAGGASVDLADAEGRTALACSIEAANLQAFQALLAHGASTETLAPLDGCPRSLSELVDLKLQRLTLIGGDHPNANNFDMQEALREIKRELIERDSNRIKQQRS
jgi:ankyrin repeat protein